MTILLNDIARCAGIQIEGHWREGCERCLRRTAPVHGDRAVMMQPPAIIAFECEYLIEEEAPTPQSTKREPARK